MCFSMLTETKDYDRYKFDLCDSKKPRISYKLKRWNDKVLSERCVKVESYGTIEYSVDRSVCDRIVAQVWRFEYI